MSVKSKNIHVLPTEKEPIKGDLLLRHIWKNNPKLECISWWRYNDTIVIDDVLQYTTLNGSFRDIASSFKAQNIYITSDEEIKDGDWVIDDENDILEVIEIERNQGLARCVNFTYVLDSCKKIILTTDQDLIKYGVQSIDDEFLEWFVNNPSCEEVEVIDDLKYFNIDELRERHLKGLPHLYSEKIGYKIIIPKEEPKQHVEFINNNIDQLDKAIESFKQETLEEVSLRLAQMLGTKDSFKYIKSAFEIGAKWQQEQDNNKYSEEDMKEAFKNGAFKWRMHSGGKCFEKWFEQFKNK